MTQLTIAKEAAAVVLRRNGSPLGMMASCDGYPEVWARDSVITLLGATIHGDEASLDYLRISIETLKKFQSRTGQVPNYVECKSGLPFWGGVDCNPWFVIGAARYVELTGNLGWGRTMADAVVRALDWCEAVDHYHFGLIHSPEMCDWADLLSHHGHVLFPNVLYVAALECGAKLIEADMPEEAARFRTRRSNAIAAIQKYFWVQYPADVIDDSHHQIRRIMSCHLRRRPYFLPWVDVSDYAEHFDTTANILAILCGVATEEQAGRILDYIDQAGVNRPYPVRVLHPAIQPGERQWREYYKLFDLNVPHQYHNGGIWPWVGGLYVAALAKVGRVERAKAELKLLEQANREHRGDEEWEFNEWLHGETGKAMGSKYQAWSAGMYVYACNAIETGQCPGFGL